MATPPTNTFETEFTAKRLDTLAEHLEYRDWTATLLEQRIAELDTKLAAGDMPILETVREVGRTMPMPLPMNEANASEADDFAAFMEA